MKNLKAQLGLETLGAVGLIFLVSAIMLSIGSDVLTQIQEVTDEDTATIKLNVTENIVAANNTFVRLTGVNYPSEILTGAFNIAVYNQTTGTVITAGNYSYNPSRYTLQVHVQNAASFGYTTGDTWTVSYNVSVKGTAYNVTESGKESIDTLSGWLPTLALILAAAIVIGVVVTSLAGKQQ